jgi:3-methylcrotonyl-CoA carboxylase alpha subunit
VEKGEITTSLIGEHLDQFIDVPAPDIEMVRAAAAAWLFRSRDQRNPDLWHGMITSREDQPEDAGLGGFRLNATPRSRIAISINGDIHEVEFDATVGETLTFEDSDETSPIEMLWRGDALLLSRAADIYVVTLPSYDVQNRSMVDGEIEAPMPGKVTAVEVKRGEKVAKGQRLLTLEAMKMEHALIAPFDGVVAELSAREGAQVSEGAVLARVVPAEE